MKITIFGAGYVGLVAAACFAEVGHHVLCMDVDSKKIEGLREGIVPIYEPGLKELVLENGKSGQLSFSDDVKTAIEHSQLILIAVGTPPDEDGSANLSQVLEVAASIGKYMENSKIVVTKSTVPVGTSDKVHAAVARELAIRNEDIECSVASNPEFLKEGAAVADFMKPDRIIVGADIEEPKQVLKELYAPFNRNSDRMVYMDIRSAELTKYAANAMLATKISFINEIANLAENLGADIEQIRKGIGSDPRIGYQYIYPGCGYGGSCFPKDVAALVEFAKEFESPVTVLEAVACANQYQKTRLYSLINQHFEGNLEGKKLAFWGLSFKPHTNDMREAPSRVLLEALWSQGVSIEAFDPAAMFEAERIYGQREDFRLVGTANAALPDADALVICTEWQHFRAPDFELIRDNLKNPVIFDGRNLYDPEQMRALGIIYYGIGRGESVKKH